MNTTFKIISLILGLAILALWIVSIAGLVYLTKFSYDSKKIPNMPNNDGDEHFRGIKITDTQLTLAKITVTLQWINLGLSALLFFIGIGYSMSGKI
jgi:hypothetical protein